MWQQRTRTKVAALGMSFIMLLSGCGVGEPKTILTLSAAASLSDSLTKVEQAFEERYPLIDLQINYGGSGALARQIEQGAPVDLFFPAGSKPMEELVERDCVQQSSVIDVVANEVVLVTSRDNTTLTSFEELASRDIERIGIGETESVPAGQYAAQVFDALGLAKQIEEKLVYGKDVREVLSWVETGSTEAGVVYKTDVNGHTNVKMIVAAKEDWHDPIRYPLGIVSNTKYQKESELLVSFIQSQQVKDMFRQQGFTVLEAAQ